jgi:hypothetical protein
MNDRTILRLAAIISAALFAVVVMALAAAPVGMLPDPENASSSSQNDLRILRHGLEVTLIQPLAG